MTIELASTEEVEALWAALVSGRVSYLSYASLSAAISRPFGSIAEVSGDAGSHVDPVSALVVDNDGVYRRVEAGWQRLGDLPTDLTAANSALREDLASLAIDKGAKLLGMYKLGAGAQADTAFSHALTSISLADYLPANKRAEARAGVDTATDHSVYLQAMLDDGHEWIDLDYGKYNLKTALVLPGNCYIQGRRIGTTLRSSVNGDLLTTAISGRRLAMEGFLVEGDLALANSAGFQLFDPATFHIKDVDFRNFNKAAIHSIQGVLHAVEDCDFVNCGETGEGAIWFDPGVTAVVLAIVDRCYVAGAAVGLKAELTRALRVNDCVFESNAVATSFDRVDGLISNSWFEANTVDGNWTDSGLLERHQVSSTNLPEGIWNKTWTTAPPAEQAIKTNKTAFGGMFNNADRTLAGAGVWTDVLFSGDLPSYLVSPRAGGSPTELGIDRRGFYTVSAKASLRATTANARNASIRAIFGGDVVTVTIANPGVVTLAGHGLVDDTPVLLGTTSALPTGLTPYTTYYVKAATANTFQLAATPGGAAINTSGVQSGQHSLWAEVKGSLTPVSLAVSQTLATAFTVKHLAKKAGLFRLQWQADNTDVFISSTGVTGVAAGSFANDATLEIAHTGVEL